MEQRKGARKKAEQCPRSLNLQGPSNLGPSHRLLDNPNEAMLCRSKSVASGTLYSVGAAEDALTESGGVFDAVDRLV